MQKSWNPRGQINFKCYTDCSFLASEVPPQLNSIGYVEPDIQDERMQKYSL